MKGVSVLLVQEVQEVLGVHWLLSSRPSQGHLVDQEARWLLVPLDLQRDHYLHCGPVYMLGV